GGAGPAGAGGSRAGARRGGTGGRRPREAAAGWADGPGRTGLAGPDADGSSLAGPAASWPGAEADQAGGRHASLFEPRSASQEAADQRDADGSSRATSEAPQPGTAGSAATETSEAEQGPTADAPGVRLPSAFEPWSVTPD